MICLCLISANCENGGLCSFGICVKLTLTFLNPESNLLGIPSLPATPKEEGFVNF